MTITDEAVGAAAEAAYNEEHETTWDQLSDGYQARLRQIARVALEAAAPYMNATRPGIGG